MFCVIFFHYHAAKKTSKNVVMLVADDGNRYVDTIYNKQWLKSKGIVL
jgi:hypothetical protein